MVEAVAEMMIGLEAQKRCVTKLIWRGVLFHKYMCLFLMIL